MVYLVFHRIAEIHLKFQASDSKFGVLSFVLSQ